MSSLIGGRSGNRGTCTQCCRLDYTLCNEKKEPLEHGYMLSTKDLNTLDYIKELIESGIDSIKIEGRMKRPEYVYYVTRMYRKSSRCLLSKPTNRDYRRRNRTIKKII